MAITERTPAGSTATGFSVKTCLPASIAAARWAGRKNGGVARITRSQSVASDLPERIEAAERGLGCRRHALGRELLPELALRPRDLVREEVAEGGDHDIGRGVDAVDRGAGAPAAAAYEANTDSLGCVGGEGAASGVERSCQRGERGRLEDFPAGQGRRRGLRVVSHHMTSSRSPLCGGVRLRSHRERRADDPPSRAATRTRRRTNQAAASRGRRAKKSACRMRSSPAKRPLPVTRMTTSATEFDEVLVDDQIAALGRERVEVAHERRVGEVEQQEEADPGEAREPREQAEDQQEPRRS